MATSKLVPDWYRHAQVWLVLDRAASAPRTVVETSRRAIDGGVDAVVCRLKELAEDDQLPIAEQVRQLCVDSATPFVMSHFPNLARSLQADAIQLGQGDPSIIEVREQLDPTMVVGYSTHSVAEAKHWLGSGADYVFLGPVYATPAKLIYGEPLGLDTVRQAMAEAAGTLVCIGGITEENLPELTACGVRRVAAIAALQRDCDPAEAVCRFKQILGRGGDHPSA